MRKQKPNWWFLYMTVPLMIVLLILEGHLPIPLGIHRILECVIVLLTFGLMFMWIKANEGLLILEEIEKDLWTSEPSQASNAALLPFADDCEESEDSEHRLEASLTKGRYN